MTALALLLLAALVCIVGVALFGADAVEWLKGRIK
jgi:hypothetical protein